MTHDDTDDERSPDATPKKPASSTTVLSPKTQAPKKHLVPVAPGEVRTVPGDTMGPRDARWFDPLGTSSRDQVDPANRPTIVERQLRWHNAFYRVPNARARTALVLATPRTGPRPVGPNGRPARVDLLWSGGTLYEVDLGLHHTVVKFDLPSSDDLSVKHAVARRRIEHRTEIENMEHRLKTLTDLHEQERRQARLDVYRAIIKAGNVEQFALQLASNPDDVRTVMHLAREERNEDRRQLTDFLSKLLSSGAIDRWEVEDQVREALGWLAESTQRAVQTGEYHERWRHVGNGRSYVP